VLRIYHQLNQKTAAVPGRGDPDRQRFGVPDGVPLAPGRPRHPAHLHQARHPRLNGKVERSHRIDGEEFYRQLKGVVIHDTQLFNDKLQEWQDYYNYHRPHGSLGGQVPYERLPAEDNRTGP
jgi:hypothetical protein